MSCEDDDYECSCHEYDFEDEDDSPVMKVIEVIDEHFQPATRVYNDKHDELLARCIGSIVDDIAGMPGDPGKLYPLHERVRRVIEALRARTKQ